jgi:Tfp pilus assembly protein PilN
MRAVNLLPRDQSRRARKSRAEQAPLIAGLGLLVLVTVALCAAFLMASSKASAKEQELKNLQTQLEILPPKPKGPTPIEAGLAGQKQSRVAALTSALSRRVFWDRVLRELSLVLPDDIWLTSLSARSPSSPASAAPPAAKAPGAAPTGLTVNGYTYSHESVARLLARLSVLPDLENVQLQRSTLARVGTQTVVQFAILADVRPPVTSA